MLSPAIVNVSQKRKRTDSLVDSQQKSIRPPPQLTSTRYENCSIDKADALRQDFTEGPARFVMSNDGSKDCIALLVPATFVDKLAELFESERKIGAIEGQLYHARSDVRDLESSLDNIQNSLKAAKTQESAEALGRRIGLQGYDLQDIRRRLKQLEEAYSLAELESSRARNHTNYVLESAMEAAGLLKHPSPAAPQKAPSLTDAVDHGDDDHIIGRNAEFIEQGPVNPNSPTERAKSAKGLAQQEVLERLGESRYKYDQAQALFDSRNDLYDHNLAEYQLRTANGECPFSRSEFDRKAVVWGQQVTGALIYAEAVFDQAREAARAMKATNSTIDEVSRDPSDMSELDELWGDHASEKRRAIDAWASNVEASSECSGDVEVDDDWDAGTVQVWDSVSAVDYGTYGKQIVRWQGICASIEKPKETLWTVSDEHFIRRRSM